jgi:hypothetical protein
MALPAGVDYTGIAGALHAVLLTPHAPVANV